MDRARRTQESYDQIASRFAERYRDRSGLHPWMRRVAAHVPADGVVLDLGAGPCLDSAELRSMGLRVVSVDRSREMLKVAREQIPGPRVQADLRRLPFRAGCIAAAWASASLLHLERSELAPALVGIREVLCPSGVLFFTLKEGVGEGWETTKYGADVPRWFTYWSESEVDEALEAAGFEVIEAATQPGAPHPWIVRIARRA
jgi:SAM-dependent methyltransferase